MDIRNQLVWDQTEGHKAFVLTAKEKTTNGKISKITQDAFSTQETPPHATMFQFLAFVPLSEKH